jgi:hypothetical protein
MHVFIKQNRNGKQRSEQKLKDKKKKQNPNIIHALNIMSFFFNLSLLKYICKIRI